MFFVMNFKDVELHSEILGALSSNTTTAPENYIKAYKWSLGLRAPAQQNPFLIGEQMYQRNLLLQNKPDGHIATDQLAQIKNAEINFDFNSVSCKSTLCTKEEISIINVQNKKKKSSLDLLKDRYMNLINYGGIASDLKPTMSNLNFHELDYLKAQNLMELEWSQKIYDGKTDEVVDKL